VGATILALPLNRSHSIRFVGQESVWTEEEGKKKPDCNERYAGDSIIHRYMIIIKAHCCHLVVTLQPITIYMVALCQFEPDRRQEVQRDLHFIGKDDLTH